MPPPLKLPLLTKTNSKSSSCSSSSISCVILVLALALIAISSCFQPLFFSSVSSSPSSYHALFLSMGSNSTAFRHLKSLTARPHVAGTPANAKTAAYVRDTFTSLSIPSHSASYSVLLSYPLHRSLSLTMNGYTHTFNLTQRPFHDSDPSAAYVDETIPTFYAYSASASVTAEAVYVNYGRGQDYEYLKANNVNFTDKIILARYGKIHCEEIVRNARVAGAAGAVVYTDPMQYSGGLQGGQFPESRWLPASGVQIGSLFIGVGDPTTPMWPSSDGCERVEIEEAMASDEMPLIPALPVSGIDGMTIHKAIGGPVAPEHWQSGTGMPVNRLGPGPGLVNLTYIGNDTMARIENVFGVIEGKEEPDRYVILGNHRDAWTFGAADPNSGTAALLELAHRLSLLQKKGWRPRRTIVLCSWDAEEYGLTGSTEWVEENREMLRSKAVAYLNVDVSVVGPGFHASATPQLDDLIKQATMMVQDPDNSSQTVYTQWSSSGISPLVGRSMGSGGSDYAAFLQEAGLPTTDMYFGEGPGYPVYHSLYDDLLWMEKFADPGFRKHVAAASIWGLMALRLADEEILPFNYMSYALELEKNAQAVDLAVGGMPLSVSPLHNSIQDFKKAVINIEDEIKALQKHYLIPQLGKDSLKARNINDRLMMAERAFTNTESYRHLIYTSSVENDWASTSYPTIVNAIVAAQSSNTSESWRAAQHEIYRVARAVTQASLVLHGRLT